MPQGVSTNRKLFALDVDMEITVTLLLLGPKIWFLTKHFKITNSVGTDFNHE